MHRVDNSEPRRVKVGELVQHGPSGSIGTFKLKALGRGGIQPLGSFSVCLLLGAGNPRLHLEIGEVSFVRMIGASRKRHVAFMTRILRVDGCKARHFLCGGQVATNNRQSSFDIYHTVRVRMHRNAVLKSQQFLDQRVQKIADFSHLCFTWTRDETNQQHILSQVSFVSW
ncbi:hypothetical protein G6F56_013557 [Rhizopus delemar]|nr:hypothetical protein G6F56_013557 [Rhizopus delemar]